MRDYENMSRNELIILARNLSYLNERNEGKVKLLTGCLGFGDFDPMNGSCVECSYDDEEQWKKCREFREKMHEYLNEKWKQEENEPKREVVVSF